LDKAVRVAIRQLEAHREAEDRPTTMRALIREGIALLLEQAGLPPMSEFGSPSPTNVVELTKRTGG